MWKFDQAENVATVTDRQVLDREAPILVVIHYSEDDSWAFVSGISDPVNDGRLISMSEAVQIDSTIEEVCLLPSGHVATRTHVGGKWKIERDENL